MEKHRVCSGEHCGEWLTEMRPGMKRGETEMRHRSVAKDKRRRESIWRGIRHNHARAKRRETTRTITVPNERLKWEAVHRWMDAACINGVYGRMQPMNRTRMQKPKKMR